MNKTAQQVKNVFDRVASQLTPAEYRAMMEAITLAQTGYSDAQIESAVVKVRQVLDDRHRGYTRAQSEGGHGALNQFLRTLYGTERSQGAPR